MSQQAQNQNSNGHKTDQGEVRKGVVLGTGKIPTRPPAAAPQSKPTAANPSKK